MRKVQAMRTLLACLLISMSAPAFAQDQTSAAISFLETGVICAPESVGTAPAPDTIAGVTNVINEDPPFVSTNNRVPAVLGIGFGAKAQASAFAGLSNVTMTVRHPAMGSDAVTLQSFQTSIRGSGPSLSFYQFDFDYELVPGIWTMEARQGAKLLYRTQFEVLEPAQVPELASVCGFEELLS